MLPLLKRGYRTPLEISDLHRLPAEEKARTHYERLKAAVAARKEDGDKKRKMLQTYMEQPE